MRLRKLLLFALSFSSVYFLFGQEDLDYNLSSPYHTVVTHLRYLQSDNFHPEISAKTIHPEIPSERAREVAIKIKQVLDGSGIYIDPEDLPTDPSYNDTISQTVKHRYVLNTNFPDIYLSRIDSRWYYSKRTVQRIDDIHEDVYPLGTDELLDLLPKLGHKEFFGLQMWQHVTILVLVICSFLLYKIFSFFFSRLIIRLLIQSGRREIARKFILPVARPTSMLLVILFLVLFVPVVQLPASTSKYLVLALKALWPVFATVVFYRLVDLLSLYFEKLAGRTETTLDDQLVPLIKKSLKTFVVIIGGLFILDNLNVPIIPLLTGLSIGGLAFALAAQDTIKNFFGSLMIFIDKPFQIGDWITSDSIDGTVEEVGFRSTRVRTFRNSVTSVPNGKLADLTIDNHGLRIYRRFYTKIAITYDTPPDLIKVFIEGLRKVVADHPHTRKDFYEINLNDFADSSLTIMFYIFFKAPTWSDELRFRHEIMLEIISLAENLNVRFAFPTQTLHVETFPEKQSLTPEYTKSSEELRKQMENYLQKNTRR